MIIANIGVIASLVALGFAVYRGWHVTMASFFAAVIVIFSSGLMFSDSLGIFFRGYAGFTADYLGKLIFSAIFAKLYEQSGAAAAIAEGITKALFREQMGMRTKVTTVLMIGLFINFVLTYGGMGTVMCVYLTYPLLMPLMERVNIPRRFAVAALCAGALDLGNIAPGAPVNPNIIAARVLGTTAAAGAVSGFLAIAVELVFNAWILGRMATRAMAKGETFSYPSTYTPPAEVEKPHALYALIPMAVVIVLFNVVRVEITTTLIIGCLIAIVMFWSWLPEKAGLTGLATKVETCKTLCAKGVSEALPAMNSMAAIMGFAAVMKSTFAYDAIVGQMSNWELPPYLMIIMITAALCAVVAGNSTGLQLALPIVAPIAAAAKIPAAALHRISVLSGSILDTMPYSGAFNLIASVCHVKVSDCYPSVFMVTVVATAIGTVVCTLLCMIGIV